jgi:hypothetical protein
METKQKKNIHKLATWSRLFTLDLENEQTRVKLRDNSHRNVTPVSSHTTALNGAAASPTDNNTK